MICMPMARRRRGQIIRSILVALPLFALVFFAYRPLAFDAYSEGRKGPAERGPLDEAARIQFTADSRLLRLRYTWEGWLIPSEKPSPAHVHPPPIVTSAPRIPGSWECDWYALGVGLRVENFEFGRRANLRVATTACYVVCVLGGLLPALFRTARIRWRRKRGRCTQCGYSLRGLTGGVCPECGCGFP